MSSALCRFFDISVQLPTVQPKSSNTIAPCSDSKLATRPSAVRHGTAAHHTVLSTAVNVEKLWRQQSSPAHSHSQWAVIEWVSEWVGEGAVGEWPPNSQRLATRHFDCTFSFLINQLVSKRHTKGYFCGERKKERKKENKKETKKQRGLADDVTTHYALRLTRFSQNSVLYCTVHLHRISNVHSLRVRVSE